MGMYNPEKLWTLWKHEEIDSQMVIGHLLQNLVKHQKVLEETNSSVAHLRREFDKLLDQIKLQSSDKPDKKGKP